MPDLPLTGPRAWHAPRRTHLHNGIDLAGHEGAPVYAAGAGVVRHAVRVYTPGFSGYGQTVTLDHDDGTHTLYGHLSRVLVEPGQRVAAGELIGAVGRTAYTAADPAALTDGPHVHFEASALAYPLAPDVERLDPVAYLAGRVYPRAPSAPTLPTLPSSPLDFAPAPAWWASTSSSSSAGRAPAWLWLGLFAGLGLAVAFSRTPAPPTRTA